MNIGICIYDPVCDIQPVDQFGFIDLTDAMTSGVVSPNVTINELDFDGDIDDTSRVGRVVKNTFDAIDNLQNVLPPR